MILDEELILNLIRKPANENITNYRDSHVTLDLYYNGGDVSDEIEKITSYENEGQKLLRQTIARSPKDVVYRILNPFHKVFSASGGSQVLDISIQSRKEEFQNHLAELPEGISLNKWMEDYWLEAYVTDPNGIIFIESESKTNPRSYPTYKSINVIHDYELEWDKFKYLILEHGEVIIGEEVKKVYRVIDDVKDALYFIDEDSLILSEKPIFHNKGFVPAVLISDIVDKKTGGRKSFINKIDELLKEYLRESSVLSIFKFLHAYPKYWQYASKCTKCNGTRKVVDPQDSTKQITCPSCNGSGLHLKMDVSDGISLPLPKGDDPIIAPNVAGFSTPPIEAWDMMQKNLDSQEKKMEFAIIGTHIEQEKSNTATGRFIDHQPVDTALHSFSETEEVIKQRVADYMAKWQYGNDYGKVTIKNGKRFVFEHPDTLWAKYVDARDRKSPITTLDYLYKEYLRSEYQNDELMFEQKMKEFYIEPLVHFSIEQLNDLTTVDSARMIQEKLHFCDWVSDTTDYSRDLETLKNEFEKYLKTKKDEKITTVASTTSTGQGIEGGNPTDQTDM